MAELYTNYRDMDNISIRTLKFLEEIGRGGITSQRELSSKLGYALGLTNFCIRQFIKKGYSKYSVNAYFLLDTVFGF